MRLYRVVELPISPAEVCADVLRDCHGAVVTFSGVVRDHSASGMRTTCLVYEAYAPMAEKVMAEIAAEAEARWPVGGIAVVHRVGRLQVGETAVVVAVSSEHRSAAFAACQYVIDSLKGRAPIWKKEISEDEESWAGGTAPPQGEAPSC